MSKKLNIDNIASELRGGSAFFPSYKKEDSPTPQPVQTQSPQTQPKPDIPERSNARTPVRHKGRRIMTRNSFETFEDQMDSLRKLSFKEKMDGRVGSMSAMVREAIDDYLAKRASEL
jgi:hypothetical protein